MSSKDKSKTKGMVSHCLILSTILNISSKMNAAILILGSAVRIDLGELLIHGVGLQSVRRGLLLSHGRHIVELTVRVDHVDPVPWHAGRQIGPGVGLLVPVGRLHQLRPELEQFEDLVHGLRLLGRRVRQALIGRLGQRLRGHEQRSIGKRVPAAVLKRLKHR